MEVCPYAMFFLAKARARDVARNDAAPQSAPVLQIAKLFYEAAPAAAPLKAE
jgi:hypothetical protein